MSTNNLRIIYSNIVDLSTTVITPSSTASSSTSQANLTKDAKSLVWRSSPASTSAKANLLLTFPTSIVGGVMLPFCNLSPTATIQVIGYTGTAPVLAGTVDSPTVTTTGSTLVFDTGAILACPYQQLGLWNWGTTLGVNSYSYGGAVYGRVWVPVSQQIACTSLVVKIIDSANTTTKYIEASRLIIGSYWSPIYNTSFGLSATMKDLSTHQRSESGDLITNRGIKYNSISFDLKYLTSADRQTFGSIMRGNGLPKPVFISLFPDNTTNWDKEQAHQVYGKLTQLPGLSLQMLDMYSTVVDIEEI